MLTFYRFFITFWPFPGKSSLYFYRFLSLFDHFSLQFIDNLGQFHWFLIDFWPLFEIFLGESSEEIIFTCFLWKNGTFSAFFGFYPIHFGPLCEIYRLNPGKLGWKKGLSRPTFRTFWHFYWFFIETMGVLPKLFNVCCFFVI